MAICAGCKRPHTDFSVYAQLPITDDGTFANGKFVCDGCYKKLIDRHMDIGTPNQLQCRADLLSLSEGE